MICTYDCGDGSCSHMRIEVIKYSLKFRFEAGTSRGVLREKDSYFLKVSHPDFSERVGLGECGLLPWLSPDLEGDLQKVFKELINYGAENGILQPETIPEIVPYSFPAIRFGLETALLDWHNGGKRMIFNSSFYRGSMKIPINGLVWMGDKRTMLQRIKEKLKEGYGCIKIKIGAIDHEQELDLLKYLRSQFSANDISIRLDANGAFSPTEAAVILEGLARYQIHSIEQPIKAGQWEAMAKISDKSPVPIALDEELIGVPDEQRAELLDVIKPAFIVLKPSLLGGCAASDAWIHDAEFRGIGWWITSALESNIGLNAIAQFTGNYNIDMPQGLGTGQLFRNNIPSPLTINQGYLSYSSIGSWDLSALF